MRSGELARLAGVTVRTLRHYHQVGVLDEPVRDTNGYRSYDVHDLVRVLRIRCLAALGVPLERMPAILDDSQAAAGEPGGAELLDELDRELADQIDRLTRQREAVAFLREHRAAPDLPPELAPATAAFAAAGISPDLVRADRDQAVLVSHLVGEEGKQHLAELYRRLSAHDVLPVLAALTERFGRLDAGSDDRELDAVVDGYVEAFGPLVTELAVSEPLPGFDRAASFLGEHSADLLRPRQRQALDLIEARLARLAGPDGATGRPAGGS